MIKKIIILFLLVAFFSCEENQETTIYTDNLLLGNWIERVYNNTDETITFKRGDKLPEKNYGISFKPEGKYLERTSGFCGTPPLNYFNVDGTYQLENNIISISTQSYPNKISWKIVALSETELVIKRAYTAREKEHQKIMELFGEISELAYSKSCTNPANWSFIGYGAKACGGFQGYIPYSNEINTTLFLEKVATYTKAEREYNINFNIISNCALAPVPKSVVCENGYATLKY